MKKKSAAWAMAMVIGLSGLSGAANVSARDYYYNDRPTGAEMWLDAALVRPMTLAATAFGAFYWVVTLPFSIPAGNADEAGKAWVADPLKYTFMRPLGEMEQDSEPSYVQKSSSL